MIEELKQVRLLVESIVGENSTDRESRRDALKLLDQAITEAEMQEPVAWMEMVVANLVREGVNKHKARELARHFYTSPLASKKPLTDEQKNILVLVRDKAMLMSLKGRIPDCGIFSEIAQDLDWLCDQLVVEESHNIKE